MSVRLRWSLICGVLLALASGLTACAGRPGGLQGPNGVAVASDGSLYVMDFGNHRVVHLGVDGKAERTFGSFGDGPRQLYHGWNIALDSQGNIYVGNTVSNDEGSIHDGVKVFSPKGRLLGEIGGQDYDPSSDDVSNKPYGTDIDSRDWLYIADYGTGLVRVFDTQGNLVDTLFNDLDSEVQFVGLNDVVLDDRRNLLYGVDFDSHVVHQFEFRLDGPSDITLTYLRTIGGYGRGPEQLAYPQYMSVDENTGYIYIGDLANRRIQVFDSEGSYVSSLAVPELSDWQVMGVTVAQDGRVYAADGLNNGIWEFASGGGEHRLIEVEQ